MIYVDTGDGYPTGQQLVDAKVAGVIAYIGTPGRPKNLTKAIAADYLAHHLDILGVFENVANDVSGGWALGVTHAQATLADARNIGLPSSTPICASADEHLTGGALLTSSSYQGGFYDAVKADGWQGKVGGYGFAEFLAIIQANRKVEWKWQAGSHPPAGSDVNIWQRNGSNGAPASMRIGSITVDIDDVLIPILNGAIVMELSDPVMSPVTGKQLDTVGNVLFWTNYYANMIPALAATITALQAAVTSLAMNPNVTVAEIEQAIDTAVASHVALTATFTPNAPAPSAPPAAN